MQKTKKSAAANGTANARFNAIRRLAEKRVRRGLAPPAAIYRVENRSRIDWSKFPQWAWPVDPEVFDRCCHEG